jgi:glycosyltransferase involved in cell wall biosynthesis
MAKILNVTVDYTKGSGGSALSVQQFSQALDAQILSLTRPSVLAISGSYSEECVHIPVSDGFLGNTYDYLPKSGAKQLRHIIANTDLVICHKLFRYHNHVILRECLSNNIPYVVVPHGSLDPYVFTYRKAQKQAWLALVGNSFLRNARAVIYATQNEEEKSRRRAPHARSQVINWYVNEPQVLDRSNCRELVCHDYGISRGEKIYLMLGRLHSTKRIFEAIRAFKDAKLPQSSLIIAGAEDEFTVRQVSSYAKSIGASNIVAIGPVYGSKKEELLAACDFSLNASYRECYCFAIVEGMSYGAPAILTPGNDLASTLAGEGCALRCADYEDSSLIEALRMSASIGDDEVDAMRMRSREWVQNRAKFERFRLQIVELVDSILYSKGPASSTF